MTGQPVHADALALRIGGAWRGVAITGPSGAGKSDLALRMMARGWRLVADDYAHVWQSGGRVWAAPPPRIAGLVEARGLGIEAVATLRLAEVRLVVAHDPEPERLPGTQRQTLAGIDLPLLRLDLMSPSCVEKVALALARL
jgi:serine kinase of HPr protein (carbohydrate metabolism regulator)